MVDEPVGGGEGETTASLGLDIANFVAGIREAFAQYEVFRSEFQKSLSIRLDPTSLNALSNAFGVQMRQALGSFKNLQNETVAESAKAVKQIASEYKKISGFEAFKEVKKQAKDAGKEMTGEMSKVASAAKQMGESIGDSIDKGVQKGTERAEKRIAQLAATTGEADKMASALVKNNEVQADRFRHSLAKTLDSYAKRLGGTQEIRQRLQAQAQVDPQLSPFITKDGAKVFDTKGAAQQLRNVRTAFREIQQDLASGGGGMLPREQQFWEGLAASVDKARRSFEKLGPVGRKAHEDFRNAERARAMQEMGYSDAQIGAMRPLSYSAGGQAESFARMIPTVDAQGNEVPRFIRQTRELEAYNAANRHAHEIERELKQRAAVEQRLTQAAKRQLDAVAGRRALLPADRQAQLSPLPAPEAAIMRGPDGKATGVDGQMFKQLNDEVRTAAGNSKTVNAALDQYNQALRTATRTANGFNERLEKIGARSTQKIDPEELLGTGPGKMVDVNAKRAAAIGKEISQMERQHKADNQRLRLTESVNDKLAKIAARRDALEQQGQLIDPAKSSRALPSAGSMMTQGRDGVWREDKAAMGQLQRDTKAMEDSLDGRIAREKAYYQAQQLRRKEATAEEKKEIDRQNEYWRAHYANLLKMRRDQATGAREHAKLLTAQQAASARADQQAVGVSGRLAGISKQTGIEFAPTSASQFLTKEGLFDKNAERRIDALIKAAQQELEKYNNWLDRRNKIIKDNAANEQRIGELAKSALAKKGANQARIDAWAAEELRRTRQTVPAMPAVGPATARLAEAQGGRPMAGPDGRPVFAPPPPPPSPPPKVDTASLNKGLRDANTEAQRLNKTTGFIGFNLAQQGANMVKWLFMYKAVHEITRAIQTSIRTFVGLGVQYNKQLEQHQLALRGILAENFDIADATGQQISGMTALTALQVTSRNQWREIQQAALSVVGTTSDLMGLYAGIMPFSAKLGANLSQVIDMTKAAAVAGSLLDISFQDTRSALISLLQGRALVRNRLVGAMGFTREEVRELKGTPELLELVAGRLNHFLLMADDASQTFAALAEQIQDFTGIIAGGFTQPMVELFKDFVKAFTDAGGAYALFERSADGLGLRQMPQLQAFVAFTSAAFGQLADDLRGFASSFAQSTNTGDIQQWVVGVRDMTSAVAGLFVVILKATVALASFIADNRELIKAFAWFTLVVSAGAAVEKLTSKILAMNFGLGALAVNLRSAAAGTVTLGAAVTKLKAAGAGAAAVMAGMGKVFAVTGIALAVGSIIQRFFQLRQAAESTREAIEAIGKGDVAAAIVGLSDGLRIGTPLQKVENAYQMVALGQKAIEDIKEIFGVEDLAHLTRLAAGDVAREFGLAIGKLDVEIQAKDALLTTSRFRAQRAEDATTGRPFVGPEEVELVSQLDELKKQLTGGPLYAAWNEATLAVRATTTEIEDLKSALAGGNVALEDSSAKYDEVTKSLAGITGTIDGLNKDISALSPATVFQDKESREIRERSKDYDHIIEREAALNNISADLVRAVIQVESAFRPGARSPKGAQGLMQLMPAAAIDAGIRPEDRLIPELNLIGGIKYLADMIRLAGGDLSLALVNYNAGMGNVQKFGAERVSQWEEPKNYVAKVTRLFEGLTATGPDAVTARMSEQASAQLTDLLSKREVALKQRDALLEEQAQLQRQISQSNAQLTDQQIDAKQTQLAQAEARLRTQEEHLQFLNRTVVEVYEEDGLQALVDLDRQRTAAEAQLAEMRKRVREADAGARAQLGEIEKRQAQQQISELAEEIESLRDRRDALMAQFERFPEAVRMLGLVVAQRSAVEAAFQRVPSPSILGRARDAVFTGELGGGQRAQFDALARERVRPAAPADLLASQEVDQQPFFAGGPKLSPAELGKELVDILASQGLGKDLGPDAAQAMRNGIQELVTATIQRLRDAGQEVTFDAVETAIQRQFIKLQSYHDVLSPFVDSYRRAGEPLVTPKDMEDAYDPGKPTFTPIAPVLSAKLDNEMRQKRAAYELEAAKFPQFQAAINDELRALEVERAQENARFIREDIERYRQYLADKDRLDDGSAPNAEERQKQFLQFSRDEQAALAVLAEAESARQVAEITRLRDFQHELQDAALQLAQATGEIFGIVEESTLASWDRTTENLKKNLQRFVRDAKDQATVDAVIESRDSQRPAAAIAASARAQERDASKSLSMAREQHSMLLQSLQAGETSSSEFLARIHDIREAIRSALIDLIQAKSAMANLVESRLINEEDPDKARQLRVELAQINNELRHAHTQLEQLESMAARIELAAQAWGNLTEQVSVFLSAASFEGTNTGLELMIKHLHTGLGLIDQITKSAMAFSKIGTAFTAFKTLFSDAGGTGGIGGSFSALGSLVTGGLFDRGPKRTVTTSPATWDVDEWGQTIGFTPEKITESVEAVKTAGQKFVAALPAIGIGISAGLTIATALFNRAVEKAKKDISASFSKIAKNLSDETATLGQSIGEAEKERQRLVQRYSRSKSGRKALKELLPDIDSQIDAMKRQAEQAKKSFEEAFRLMVDAGGNTVKAGPFADFMREMINLEKFIKDYLDSINTTTASGLQEMARALERVGLYVNAFFENAKLQFGEALLGFESEALSSQERLFSLYNNRDGLYKQLRDIGEARQDLEEAIADEMERREQAQNKLNDLAKKEAEIRKRIADIIRQAAEDEMAIRRRGVLEAQLSVAHQKAIDISNIRYKAQEEIEKLKQELADLQNKIDDETKANARKDRDFDRQRRNLDEREAEVRKEIRLNDIRIDGAQAVANIQGEIFGLASDEFDLAVRQNDIGIRQAEIQVAKWRETKQLFDAIVRGADGFLFDPPDYFPQIKVDLGSIVIDNRDMSSNTFNGTGTPGPGHRPNPGVPSTGTAVPRPVFDDGLEIEDIGDDARRQGFGDV